MLNQNVIAKMKEIGDYTEEKVEENLILCKKLGLEIDSTICQYFSHIYQSPDLMGRDSYVLWNLVWFEKEGGYSKEKSRLLNSLEISLDLFPLDSFEGEGGYFYNPSDRSVIYLELGENLQRFHSGEIVKKFENFNLFLEWFYEMD